MNRSILIVICDFIVLSVLSLNFGVGSGQQLNVGRGGGVVMDERSAKKIIRELKWRRRQLQASARKLQEANRRIGFLEKRQKQLEVIQVELAKTRKSLEIMEGKANPEDVDKKLKEELEKTAKLTANLSSMKKELDFISDRYRNTTEALGATRDELESARKKLTERKSQLAIVSKELDYTKNKLESAKNTLADTSSKLKNTESSLQETKNSLDKTQGELKDIRTAHSKTSNNLSFTKGQLIATEKELGGTKEQLNQTNEKLMQANIELVTTRKKLESLQSMLKSAVTELSSTKRNLSQTKNTLTSTKSSLEQTQSKLSKTETELVKVKTVASSTAESLDQTKKRLTEAEGKLQNNSLKNYSAAVVKLLFSVREKRLLVDYKHSAQWYQPMVKIGNRTFLVVNFEEITGLDQPITGHANILSLKYNITPTTGSGSERITSLIQPLESDLRVCMIEVVPPKKVVPLKPITYSDLRKRGIQNLYLFKNGSFGKKSSGLNGRVSMNLDGKDPYLYIRNSSRASDSELKADVGDCVITKQGNFVGIIVQVSRHSTNQQQVAKCYIFPDRLMFNPELAIPVTKSPGSEYYNKYLKQVDAVRRLIKNKVNSNQNI